MISLCPPHANWASVQRARSYQQQAEVLAVEEFVQQLRQPTQHWSSGRGASRNAKDLRHLLSAQLSGHWDKLMRGIGHEDDPIHAHIPAIAALSGALHPMVKQICHSSTTRDCMTGPCPRILHGGMINFGYSGGATVGKDCDILCRQWADIGDVMRNLGLVWFFGIACRCPAHVDLTIAVPDFGFALNGPRVAQCGAVTLLVDPNMLEEITHMPDIAKTVHTCWARVGSTTIWGGFSIEPRRRGRNESARIDQIKQLFREYDEVAAAVKQSPVTIHIAGDMNPSDDIWLPFHQAMRDRGLAMMIDESTETHVKGRRLDVVGSPAETGPPEHLLVHNGEHCRSHGCRRLQCGNLAAYLGSKDLDHHPVTWATLVSDVDNRRMPVLKYSRIPELWHAAVEQHARPALECLAAELNIMRETSHLRCAQRSDVKPIIDAGAVIWRTLVTLSGLLAGLITVRYPGHPQIPGASAKAFGDMCAEIGRARKLARRDPEAAEIVIANAWRTRKMAKNYEKKSRSRQVQCQLMDIAGTDVQRAATILKNLGKHPTQELGLCMRDPEDPSTYLAGNSEVIGGAVRYMQMRESPPWQTKWDMHAAQRVTARIEQLRSRAVQMLDAWDANMIFTEEERRQAFKGIDMNASCRSLPYAALCCGSETISGSYLAIANLQLKVATVADLWLEQDKYHKAKPKRSRLDFEGYRELALCEAEGRGLEELWMHRWGPMVRAAWGSRQDGGGDTRISALIDLEVHSIRHALGLPSADLFTDKREAFDTQWPEECLLVLWDRGLPELTDRPHLRSRAYLLADTLMTRNKVTVMRSGLRSRPFTPKVGMPEGKKMSLAQYCLCAAQEVDDLADVPDMGIGVNPAPEVIGAFHKHTNQSDAGILDLGEVDIWWDLLQNNRASWDTAFAHASSDAVRLCLLNRSCTLRVGPRCYVDDIRHKTDSRGHSQMTLEKVWEAEARHRSCLKYGLVVAHGFPDTRPIGDRERVIFMEAQHTSLGIVRSDTPTPEHHLKEVERKAATTLGMHMMTFRIFDFDWWAVLQCFDTVTKKVALHGAELCIHCPSALCRFDAIQERWGRTLFDLSVRIPRIVLYKELGWIRHLSSDTMGDAAMLYNRILYDKRYVDAARILAEAAEHKGTWTASVRTWMQQTSVRRAAEVCPGIATKLPPAMKFALKRYRKEHLVCRIENAIESPWRHRPLQRAYVDRDFGALWHAKDLMATGIRLSMVQAWAQFRLQGHFTTDPTGSLDRCRLRRRADETAAHLLEDCVSSARCIHTWAMKWRLGHLSQGGSLHRFVMGSAPWDLRFAAVDLAYRLKKECTRSSYAEESSMDTTDEEDEAKL